MRFRSPGRLYQHARTSCCVRSSGGVRCVLRIASQAQATACAPRPPPAGRWRAAPRRSWSGTPPVAVRGRPPGSGGPSATGWVTPAGLRSERNERECGPVVRPVTPPVTPPAPAVGAVRTWWGGAPGGTRTLATPLRSRLLSPSVAPALSLWRSRWNRADRSLMPAAQNRVTPRVTPRRASTTVRRRPVSLHLPPGRPTRAGAGARAPRTATSGNGGGERAARRAGRATAVPTAAPDGSNSAPPWASTAPRSKAWWRRRPPGRRRGGPPAAACCPPGP